MVGPANGRLAAAGAVVGAAAGAVVGAAAAGAVVAAGFAAAVVGAAAGGAVAAGSGVAGDCWHASRSGIAINPPPSVNSSLRRETTLWSERVVMSVSPSFGGH